MTTITLPIHHKDFSPNLPLAPPYEGNWLSKPIEWVRNADSKSLIHRVSVYMIALFVSIVLVASVIFSPIFIFGYKEYIRQCERGRYDKAYANLLEMATKKAKHDFLKGRLLPIESIPIQLNRSTRKLMIKDLEIPEKVARDKTDSDLLMMAAAKYDDFILRYRLRLYS